MDATSKRSKYISGFFRASAVDTGKLAFPGHTRESYSFITSTSTRTTFTKFQPSIKLQLSLQKLQLTSQPVPAILLHPFSQPAHDLQPLSTLSIFSPVAHVCQVNRRRM